MHAELIPALLPFPAGPPRTEGVHLSGLIRSMAADYGFLDKSYVENLKLVELSGSGEAWWVNLEEDAQIRMSIGLAWECWYLPQVKGVIHQPGEMSIDGIYMTPDGQSLDVIMGERGRSKHVLALHEVKVTTKSITTVGDINFFNAKNWLWLTQVMCNCKAMETLLAYLHILYLYGDYKKPFTPKLHIWRMEFEQAELDKCWARVRDYRDEAAAKGLLEVR